MFEHLKKHKKILVTGPHRSGTTIAAAMIGHDTGHFFCPEENCWLPDGDLQLLRWWMDDFNGKVVCQAPFAADVCHSFGEALIVFMMRDVADILECQKRHDLRDGRPASWHRIESIENRKYDPGHLSVGRASAATKYEHWQDQKQFTKNYIELEFESLSGHPFWVSKEKREDFHIRQIGQDGDVCGVG